MGNICEVCTTVQGIAVQGRKEGCVGNGVGRLLRTYIRKRSRVLEKSDISRRIEAGKRLLG